MEGGNKRVCRYRFHVLRPRLTHTSTTAEPTPRTTADVLGGDQLSGKGSAGCYGCGCVFLGKEALTQLDVALQRIHGELVLFGSSPKTPG